MTIKGRSHMSCGTRALLRQVDRFDPDLVYVWNMRHLSKSLLFQLQEEGIPLVFDIHSYWLSPEKFSEDPGFCFGLRIEGRSTDGLDLW